MVPLDLLLDSSEVDSVADENEAIRVPIKKVLESPIGAVRVIGQDSTVSK